MAAQENLFGSEKKYRLGKLSNKTIIRSVSHNQSKILSWIIRLYCPDGFDLDPTYSRGQFYKVIPEPKIKMDLNPQAPDTICADVKALPLKSDSLNSIVFDPPFLVGGGTMGKIKKRFSMLKTVEGHLWPLYYSALSECYRVLKKDGILVFKCQDTVGGNRQFFSHNIVLDYATKIGFCAEDLFILTRDTIMIGHQDHNQRHARKFHSYFWVFSKA